MNIFIILLLIFVGAIFLFVPRSDTYYCYDFVTNKTFTRSYPPSDLVMYKNSDNKVVIGRMEVAGDDYNYISILRKLSIPSKQRIVYRIIDTDGNTENVKSGRQMLYLTN